MSFVSNIVQFTFVPSMSTHSFIKINADTVRFHKTTFSQKSSVVTSATRITWFIRRLPSNVFSGVNFNCRHWSASEKPSIIINNTIKENTGKTDGHKRSEYDDNNININYYNV